MRQKCTTPAGLEVLPATCVKHSRPGSEDGVSVGRDPPTVAQIADQVPVHGGLVGGAGLGIGPTQGQVNGARHLLVEQDVAGGTVDAGVGPDPQLPEVARAVIGGQRGPQILLAALGPGFDDLPVTEGQLDAGHGHPARAGGDGEADDAVGRVLERPGEHLPGGHVAPPVGVDPGPSRDAEADVGAVSLDPDFPGVLEALDQRGLARVVSIQNPYNLLNRSFEIGLAEMAIREDVGLLAYSPLAFGVLSGKFLNGARPPESRVVRWSRFVRYSGEIADRTTAAYVGIARQHGLDPAQMALAFVTRQRFVSSNLIGATTMEQLKTNVGGATINLPEDVIEAIEAVHRAQPNPCP